MLGLFDAEGNFTIRHDKKNNLFQLVVRFSFHLDELPLLQFFKETFQCGSIYSDKNKCEYIVTDIDALNCIFMPIFSEFLLNSSKYLNYLSFKEAFNIRLSGNHLTPESRSRMLKIKNQMNKNRIDFSLPDSHKVNITTY